MGVATGMLGWDLLVPGTNAELVTPADGTVARILSVWIYNTSAATRNPLLLIVPSGGIGVRTLTRVPVATLSTVVLTSLICLGPGQSLGASVTGGSAGDILVAVFGSWLLGEQNVDFYQP